MSNARGSPRYVTVMQADHDMRHHFHPRGCERGQCGFEILDRPVQVIDITDRLFGADHIHHRRIDTGRFHRFRPRLVDQGRMDRDLQMRKIVLELFHHRIEALIFDFVALVGAAGEQKALQILQQHEIAHLAVQHLRRGGRDHGLENLGLAMIAIERACPGRDRKGREAVLVAAGEFARGIFLEGRRRKADRPPRNGSRGGLHLSQQGGVERRVFQGFDGGEFVTPAHALPRLCEFSNMKHARNP